MGEITWPWTGSGSWIIILVYIFFIGSNFSKDDTTKMTLDFSIIRRPTVTWLSKKYVVEYITQLNMYSKTKKKEYEKMDE